MNEVRQEVRSPDGRTKAVLFTRNCGATTGFNTQISLLAAGNQPGNAFIIDQGEANIIWDKHGTLLVTFDPGARIFRRESTVHGVTLKYQETLKAN